MSIEFELERLVQSMSIEFELERLAQSMSVDSYLYTFSLKIKSTQWKI
jgi:hypothetical protein